MTITSIEHRAARLSDKLQPRPRIIHCAGARDELIARLEYQIANEDDDQGKQDELSAEDLETLYLELTDCLERSCREIEQCYNVRLVD